MKQLNLWAAVGAFAFTVLAHTAPASAAVTFIGTTRPCSTSDIAGATACAGYYVGNGIAGTSDAADNRLDAFTRLGLSGTPTIIDSVDSVSGVTTGVIDFGQLLFGRTVISAHWGAGSGGAPVSRPLKELKAFQKVNLKPGQKQTVTLELPRESFAFFDTKMEQWRIDAGAEFEILIGSSSRDIRLRSRIKLVKGAMWND